MLSMIGHAIFGLIVGLVARFLLPVPNPAGLIVTANSGSRRRVAWRTDRPVVRLV
jgi:hypothetical protein